MNVEIRVDDFKRRKGLRALNEQMPELTSPPHLQTFFIPTPPSFAPLAAIEIEYWLKRHSEYTQTWIHSILVTTEGVEICLPLEVGYWLNYCLKVPHRILLRRYSFKVKDGPKLFNKLRRLNWGPFCTSDVIRWHVSTRASRLNNQSKILDICEQAYAAYRKAQPAGKALNANVQNIFLRIVNDLCTISIDTSGEHLHRRGYRKWTSSAPIRENLAAAILLQLLQTSPLQEGSPHALVDPMVGSGTFLAEAGLLFSQNFNRDYSFLYFKKPFHSKITPIALPPIYPFDPLLGRDKDFKAISIAQRNLQTLNDQPLRLTLQQADLEGEHPNSQPPSNIWLVCNPPYGERLDGQFSKQKTKARLMGFINSSIQTWQPIRMGWILPLVHAPDLRANGYILRQQIRFKNGGIPVLLGIWDRAYNLTDPTASK